MTLKELEAASKKLKVTKELLVGESVPVLDLVSKVKPTEEPVQLTLEKEFTVGYKIPWWLPLLNSVSEIRNLYDIPEHKPYVKERAYHLTDFEELGPYNECHAFLVTGFHPILFKHAVTLLCSLPANIRRVKVTATDMEGKQYEICNRVL